jgi:hypothetical protein
MMQRDGYAILLAAHRGVFDEMEGPVERDLRDTDLRENQLRTAKACRQMEQFCRLVDGDTRGLRR